jgi:hypothetical protein
MICAPAEACFQKTRPGSTGGRKRVADPSLEFTPRCLFVFVSNALRGHSTDFFTALKSSNPEELACRKVLDLI